MAAAASHGLSPSASININLIRGVSAVAVVISHWRYLFFVNSASAAQSRPLALFYFLSGLGHQAVMVFFALSGFLVGGSAYHSMQDGRWSWKKYLIDRGVRLWIVVIPALGATAFLDWYGISHLHGSIYEGSAQYAAMLPDQVARHLSFTDFVGNLAFVQGILTPTFGSNGPLWSLANEFWYYLAFPLLLLACRAGESMHRRVICAALCVAILIFVGREISLYFIVWLLGAGLAIRPRMPLLGNRWAKAVVLLLWTGALVVTKSNRLPTDLAMVGLLGTSTALLIGCVVAAKPTDQPQPYRWLADALSHVSYTGYLFHTPFLVLAAAVLLHGRRWQPTGPLIIEALGILGVTVLYIVLAWFLFEHHTAGIRAAIYSWAGVDRR